MLLVEDDRPGDPGPSTRSMAPWRRRVWEGYRRGGMRYVLHKALRRLPLPELSLRRATLFSDPRSYWTRRGGLDYFAEQEGQPARTWRAGWLADKIAALRPGSVLEVGCGYGKQLATLRDAIDTPVSLTGVDYSPTQLAQARRYLAARDLDGIALALADGGRLPFPDNAFDLVFTSAVVLHNPEPIAERMRREVVRVARRWAVHNEDTNVTYNRFGYNIADWYRDRGIPLIEAGPIPFPAGLEPLADHSLFCVADLS